MASTSNIVAQFIHYVYTWLPRTAKNARGRKKNSRKCKKRVNFSQPLTLEEKSEISYHQLEGLKSSHGFPSTPTGPTDISLHSLVNGCEGQERFSQEFSSCKLEVVGYKFLFKAKKLSKRSALKKWLRQRTNVVHNEKFHLEEQFCAGRRHDLCYREVFECSPKFADSRFQRGNQGLKGRRLHRRQWSRETLDRTFDEELNETNGSVIDLDESLSVISVRPSCA